MFKPDAVSLLHNGTPYISLSKGTWGTMVMMMMINSLQAQLENPESDTTSSALHDQSCYHGVSYMEK